MTQEELTDLCAFWQQRLRLQDWRIAVSICRARDLPSVGYDSQGTCSMTRTRKEALIHILDPADYPPNEMFPQDMEATLVHELLEIHFDPFKRSKPGRRHRDQELAIEVIAQALVVTRREGKATE